MSAQRMLFLTMATVLAIGIYLSGYDKVHWLLYLPCVALAFAGVTGFCPGVAAFRKLGFK